MREPRRSPKISTRCPMAEATIGIGAIAAVAASILVVSGIEGALGGCLALIMAAIAVIDGRHFIIPNELTGASFVLGLVDAALRTPEIAMREMVDGSLRAVALAGVFLAVRALYQGLRHREGIGLGDVKLAGVAGAWLDWNMMPVSVDVAALAALSVYGAQYFIRGVAPVRAQPIALRPISCARNLAVLAPGNNPLWTVTRGGPAANRQVSEIMVVALESLLALSLTHRPPLES
jgi:leader peptidase (prepilin peptidase) / N-methyltransferase